MRRTKDFLPSKSLEWPEGNVLTVKAHASSGGQSCANSGALRQLDKLRIPIVFLSTFREFSLFYCAQWA